MKSGAKTSEFWLALAGIVSMLFSSKLGLKIQADKLFEAVMIMSSVYSAGRSYVKGRNP